MILNRMMPRYIRTSFAYPLKEALTNLCLFTNEQLNTELRDVKDDRWSKTPRDMMQFVGTELLRDILDRDIFIKNMAERTRDYQFLIIGDVRFENEAKWIQAQGGMVWLISDACPPTSTHPSEQLPKSSFPFDVHIRNVGDLDSLTHALRGELERHRLQHRK